MAEPQQADGPVGYNVPGHVELPREPGEIRVGIPENGHDPDPGIAPGGCFPPPEPHHCGPDFPFEWGSPGMEPHVPWAMPTNPLWDWEMPSHEPIGIPM